MKALRILDAATEIRALAFRMDEPGAGEGRPIVAGAGYGRTDEQQHAYVALINLVNSEFTTDPFGWADWTMRSAHLWLVDHFDELQSGDSIDVEPLRLAHVLGERAATPEHDSPVGYQAEVPR